MDLNTIVSSFLREHQHYVLMYIVLLSIYPITYIIVPKLYAHIIESVTQNKPLQIKYFGSIVVTLIIMRGIKARLDATFYPKLQSYVRTKILETIKTRQPEEVHDLLLEAPFEVEQLICSVVNVIAPAIIISLLVLARFTQIRMVLGLFALIACLVGFSFTSHSFNKYLHATTASRSAVRTTKNAFNGFLTDPNIRDELIKNEHIITNLQITKVAEYNNLEARIDVIMFVIFGSIITVAYKLYKTKQLSQEQTVVVMITSLLVLQRYRSFTEELPDIYALSEHYRQVNQILSL